MASKTPLPGKSLYDLRPDVAGEWDFDKNKGTPGDVKVFSASKRWWICHKNHSWEACVNKRTKRNQGCPYCSGRRADSTTCLTAQYPKLLEEWDFELNTLTPDTVLPYTSQKVWWVCGKNHSWESSVSNRVQGRRCPFCSGKKVSVDNSLAKTHPDISIEWDFSKNSSDLSPNNISRGSNKKVWWVCEKEHSWETSVGHRTEGTNCPYCSNQKVCVDNSLKCVKPSFLLEWDTEKNLVSPDDLTSVSSKKVWWLCEKGHSWKTAVYNRAQGKGCPYCSGNKVGYGNSLAEERPEIAEQWDLEANTIRPTEVRPGSNKIVWWKCGEGHSWRTSVNNKTTGTTCPFCISSTISKISQEWLDSLGIEDREVRLKIKAKAFTVDGFDPKTNTIYEFLGDFWHGNPEKFPPEDINPVSKKSFGELYDRTFRRFAKLEEAGYNIVFIWEKEFKNAKRNGLEGHGA